MDFEPRFQQLADDLTPSTEQHARVRSVLKRRIEGPAYLRVAKEESTPVAAQKKTLWNQIAEHIALPGLSTAFDRIRAYLSPGSAAQSRIRESIFAHIAPPVPVPFFQRFSKWGAAFIIVVLALRASPFLFLTPQSSADSSVLLNPSDTGVELSSHGLWQQVTKEVELHEAVALRTNEGEATLMLHDDGNVRLGANTTMSLDDVTDLPSTTPHIPTLSISSGTVWLQALLPDQVRGFVVATPLGTITVRGGSVSVHVADSVVHVETWDRHATVTHDGQSIALVAGEAVDMIKNQKMIVQKIPADAYKGSWVSQNLQRDAVHQRELAQLQQERRAAEAGILPNSPFYSVKRVAENVDVLLTLDPEARVQKRLQQAGTRLNEAAALILQGDSGASIPLDEYRQTLIEVASGTGNSIGQYLVQQQVAENAAQLSAALPDSQLYVLKKAVLEASAQIPNDMVDQRDVSGTLLVDTLDFLQQAVQNNNVEQMKQSLEALAPYLPSLQTDNDSVLKPEVRKEALSLLSAVAAALKQADSTATGSTISQDIALQLAAYMPAEEATSQESATGTPVTVISASLSDAELSTAVRASMHRVFDIYTMPHSRINALRVEMKKFQGSVDEGRFLRRFYRDMPDNETFRQIVRTAIQNLRVEQFAEDDVQTGSGGVQ